ncbi:MAG: YIP1 family protein [Acidobacteria bacterium]|nr:YIP1 family protein [Acidobacteriota bacterium]
MSTVETPATEDKQVYEPKPKYSDFQRLIGTLAFPSEVFNDINIKPNLLLPLVMAIVVSLASGLIIIERLNVNWENIYSKAFDEQMAKQGKSRADLSQQEKDALDGQVKTMAKVAPYFVYINPILFCLAFPAILAAVFLAGATLMGGATLYKKVLSVVIHVFAMVTIFVQSILNILIAFLKDPKDLDITKGTLIASSPAALMPENASKILVSILSQFDIFTIWSLILISIGLAAISKNLSKKLAFLTIFGLWSIYALVAISLKILFS